MNIVDSATEAKCIKQAEAIISYYCNLKGIHGDDREEFRSEGLLGMSVALDRLNTGVTHKKGAATTYCNAYVKGYLKNYHTIRFERRRGTFKGVPTWYHVHQPKSLDVIEPDKNKWLSYNGTEDRAIAKDFMAKVFEVLTEKEKEVLGLYYLEGYTPTEIFQCLGRGSKTIVGGCQREAFKKIRKLYFDNVDYKLFEQNNSQTFRVRSMNRG